MKIKHLLPLALLPLFAVAQPKIKLPAILSDNMLLQQKTTTKIWGKATPGSSISVKTDWNVSGTALSDNSGNWQLAIKTPEAGGPHSITVSTVDTAIIIKNILVGEVWFCSGQSNMEMPMAGWPPNDTIMHSAKEIASANYPNIRFFNVEKAYSADPLADCVGKWEECTPQTIKPFSATAWFFGKKLYDNLKSPIGLIESAWGGTPIEAWISNSSMTTQSDFTELLDLNKQLVPKIKEYSEWREALPQINLPKDNDDRKWQNLNFNDKTVSSENYDDSKWQTTKLPGSIEQSLIGDFDGAFWYRRSVEIPENMLGGDLTLSLGPIDDMDEVWVNGVSVGKTLAEGNWQVDRIYTVPASILKKGANVIAIRVIDTQGGGGLWGNYEKLFLSVKNNPHVSISIAGTWKVLPVAEFINNKFYVFEPSTQEFFNITRPLSLGQNSPTLLYNAMVNPIIPYAVKGAIWYQGEANVGRAKQYSRLLPLLINDWRKAWNNPNLSFYYDQIAPYVYDNKDSSASAEIREVQALAQKTPNTGMAVLLDAGVVSNIHPPYKKEAGERLANWALAKNYGMKIPYSGPVFKSMKIEGNTIKLQFDFVEDGLQTKDKELKEFEVAASDGKYVPVEANIVGKNEVWLSSQNIQKPAKVRYCYRNGSKASLFNSAALPASTFRVEK
jgi:sialate O-acetylesterase